MDSRAVEPKPELDALLAGYVDNNGEKRLRPLDRLRIAFLGKLDELETCQSDLQARDDGPAAGSSNAIHDYRPADLAVSLDWDAHDADRSV